MSHSCGSLETLSIQFLLITHASSLTFFLPNVCTEDMFYLSVLLNGRISSLRVDDKLKSEDRG